MNDLHPDTHQYNERQAGRDREICERLVREIEHGLPEAENKVWQAHPVWFLDGNPIVDTTNKRIFSRRHDNSPG